MGDTGAWIAGGIACACGVGSPMNRLLQQRTRGAGPRYTAQPSAIDLFLRSARRFSR